jgi:MerC mercury resistance protein
LQERVDRVGIVVSTACAVHCAVGTTLVTAPGLGRLFADERIETGFAGVALLVAVCALSAGFRRHRQAAPVMLGIVGVAALATARLVEIVPRWTEVLVSIAGASLLIGAHLWNLRTLRCSGACCAANPRRG